MTIPSFKKNWKLGYESSVDEIYIYILPFDFIRIMFIPKRKYVGVYYNLDTLE